MSEAASAIGPAATWGSRLRMRSR